MSSRLLLLLFAASLYAQAPGGINLSSGLNCTGTKSQGDVPTWNSSTGRCEWAQPPGATGGEANTASAFGATGVAVIKDKSGVDLRFRKIASANSLLNVALSGDPDDYVKLTISRSDFPNTIATQTDFQFESEVQNREVVKWNSSLGKWTNQLLTASDIFSTILVTGGGTGSGTPSGARANLGAAGEPSVNGFNVRTAANTAVARTFQGTANEISITNGSGVSGDPVAAIAASMDLSAKTATAPMKSGTLASRPSTCRASIDMYNVTNPGTAGQHVYVCNSAGNGWNLIGDGSGSGASQFSSLTDVDVTSPANTQLSFYYSATGKWKNANFTSDGSQCVTPTRIDASNVELAINPSACRAAMETAGDATISAVGDTVPSGNSTVTANVTGNLTLTSTPSIAAGQDGQKLTVTNTSTSNTLTLQDRAALSNSQICNGGSNLPIGPRKSADFVYSSDLTCWSVRGSAGGGGSIATTTSVLKGDNAGGAVAATANTDFAAATHASRHQHGGADEVATATAAANAIPKAGAGGTLAAAWLPISKVKQTIPLNPAVITTSATMSGGWALPASSPAVLGTVSVGEATGGQMRRGYIEFGTSADTFAANAFMIPTAWDGSSITAKIGFHLQSGFSGGQSVDFGIDSFCQATNESTAASPTYNAGSSVATTISTATAGQYYITAPITIPITGCAAGEVMTMRLSRRTGTDDGAAGARVTDFSVDVLLNLQ